MIPRTCAITHRFGEAIPYPRDENEDVHQIALSGESKQVREKHDHQLARPDIVLDDPLKGVRPVLRVIRV